MYVACSGDVVSLWSVGGDHCSPLHLSRKTATRRRGPDILDDSFEQEKGCPGAHVAKVNKIEPSLHVMKWLVAAATLVLDRYYIWDIITSSNKPLFSPVTSPSANGGC